MKSAGADRERIFTGAKIPKTEKYGMYFPFLELHESGEIHCSAEGD